jgi:hypothetical protein
MGREEVQTGFWRESMRKVDHLEDTDVDGRIIVRWILVGWGMDWIDLAQDRGRRRGSCKRGNEIRGSIKWG